MSSESFEKKVLEDLDSILGFFTESSKESVELRRIILRQETIVNELETELRRLRENFQKIKNENEKLLLELQQEQEKNDELIQNQKLSEKKHLNIT